MNTIVLALLISSSLLTVNAQTTVQRNVAATIEPCYAFEHLQNRDNRPPMTIQVLIDILRQAERTTLTPNVNMRQLVTGLIHRFRQDGIVYNGDGISTARNILPYSPSSFQFARHRLLLAELIPQSTYTFNNNSLSMPQQCALHEMFSSTVEIRQRGNEGTVCSQLSQYRTSRVPRSADDHDMHYRGSMNGKLKSMSPKDEVDIDVNLDLEDSVIAQRQTATSACPLEAGVIHTPWGAVASGQLLGGIAAGTEMQQVAINNLMKSSDLEFANQQALTVSNVFAATLSGDLAEAGLQQGTYADSITLGGTGGWGSTQARRDFFIQRTTGFEMTDQEIRGGIDGLVLGLNIRTFQAWVPEIRLSQILDMYYSEYGLETQNVRACDRQSLLQIVTTRDILTTETLNFMAPLDQNMILSGSRNQLTRNALTQEVITSFYNYIETSLNDLSCAVTDSTMRTQMRTGANIFLVVDGGIQYNTIYPLISSILDQIEVSPFNSVVRLLNAIDGNLVINATDSIADFHERYTLAVHQAIPSGVNLLQSIVTLRRLLTEELIQEQAINFNGGNSTVVLHLTSTINLSPQDLVLTQEHVEFIRQQVPDAVLLFATPQANTDILQNIVVNTATDVFTISTTQINIQNSDVTPIVNRIREVPRRISNPLCGATWVNVNGGLRSFTGYVEPLGSVFYRVHPNYFFGSANRAIRIQGSGFGTLTVCQSRATQNPTPAQAAQDDVTCTSVTTNTMEINLSGACDGHGTIAGCPPLFIGVHSVTGDVSGSQCTEIGCRFPFSIRYTVQQQDLGCFSSAGRILINISLLSAVLLIVMKLF